MVSVVYNNHMSSISIIWVDLPPNSSLCQCDYLPYSFPPFFHVSVFCTWTCLYFHEYIPNFLFAMPAGAFVDKQKECTGFSLKLICMSSKIFYSSD